MGVDKTLRGALAASVTGALLAWYSLFLYTSGAIYIAHAFLPKGGPLSSLTSTLLIFGVGFFPRPLGALVFGHLGDRVGRRTTLLVTLLTTGASTTGIGLLPTYSQAGPTSTLALVALRLLLGFAIGGEWGGSILLTLETFKVRRGFWGSFVQSTIGIGLTLSALAYFTLTVTLPTTAMYQWGWRIPYLLSIPLMLLAIHYRLKAPETPIYQAAKSQGQVASAPIRELFKHHKTNLLLGTLIVASSGTMYYVGVTLLPTLFQTQQVVEPQLAQTAIILFAASEIIFVFTGGILSDRLGRRAMLLASNTIFLIIVYPSLLIRTPTTLLTSMVLYGLAHGIGHTAEGNIISEIYPTNTRYTGNSLTYQLANSYIAGLAPYASITLGSNSPYLYPAYSLALSILAITSTIKIKETKNIDLENPKNPTQK